MSASNWQRMGQMVPDSPDEVPVTDGFTQGWLVAEAVGFEPTVEFPLR